MGTFSFGSGFVSRGDRVSARKSWSPGSNFIDVPRCVLVQVQSGWVYINTLYSMGQLCMNYVTSFGYGVFGFGFAEFETIE